MTDTTQRSREIAALNDQARTSFTGCRLFITCGISELPELIQDQILRKVRAFDTFTPDNDPYGEHDFGAFDHGGERIFWKIDYYDTELENGSPDPADPEVTTRVLTILLADEW
jgi:hypothetical protein